MTLSRAFGQLTIAFVSATSVLLAFYLKSNSLMAFAGVVFGFAVYYSRVNLEKAFRGRSEQAAQK